MRVQRGEILFYYVCKFIYFNGPVVEQCFPFCYYNAVSWLATMSELLERTSAPRRMADLEPGTDGMSNVHSANLPNFSIVDVIPLPISAALLANSDRAPFLEPLPSPMGDPFAACLCDSVSSDCL